MPSHSEGTRESVSSPSSFYASLSQTHYRRDQKHTDLSKNSCLTWVAIFQLAFVSDALPQRRYAHHSDDWQNARWRHRQRNQHPVQAISIIVPDTHKVVVCKRFEDKVTREENCERHELVEEDAMIVEPVRESDHHADLPRGGDCVASASCNDHPRVVSNEKQTCVGQSRHTVSVLDGKTLIYECVLL